MKFNILLPELIKDIGKVFTFRWFYMHKKIIYIS